LHKSEFGPATNCSLPFSQRKTLLNIKCQTGGVGVRAGVDVGVGVGVGAVSEGAYSL